MFWGHGARPRLLLPGSLCLLGLERLLHSHRGAATRRGGTSGRLGAKITCKSALYLRMFANYLLCIYFVYRLYKNNLIYSCYFWYHVYYACHVDIVIVVPSSQALRPGHTSS